MTIASTDADRLTRAILDQLGKSALQVSLPGSDGYARATQIWNGAVMREPLLIAHCSNANEARTALRAAQACGAEISVRGGGHDWTGRSLCPRGVVIDLSKMRHVSVDVESMQAVIGGGATAMDVCEAAAAHSLSAVTSYSGATAGMGGVLLGGGYGPLTPRFGLCCDSLLSAEVLLADGRIVTASDTENPDLFWALRGGGGNFGVVTSMRIRLYDLPALIAGSIVFPWSDAQPVLSGYARAMTAAPDELAASCVMTVSPDGQPVVVVAPVWSGDPQRAQRVMSQLQELGTPVLTQIGPTSCDQLLGRNESSVPKGRHYAVSTRWLRHLDSAVIAALIASFEARVSPLSILALHHFHGAAARIAPGATAFGMREEHFTMLTYSAWEPGLAGDIHRNWARDASSSLLPYSLPGGYANLLSPDNREQIAGAYGANSARLRALKHQFDPRNVFSSAIALPS